MCVRALFVVADGGYSHLYVLLPIAVDLAARGHDVAVVAPARLAAVAETFGVAAIPLPEAPAKAGTGDGGTGDGGTGGGRAVDRGHRDDGGPGEGRQGGAGEDGHPGTGEGSRRGAGEGGHGGTGARGAGAPSLPRARSAVGRYLAEAARDAGFVAGTARDWGADVLVRETAAWSAWLAGELTGLPVALFDYAPTPPRLLAAMLGDLFGAARAQAGLPPDPALTTLHRWLHLLAGPPGWFPPRSIGPATHLLQPPPPLPGSFAMPDWLADLDAARPGVYVTLGTMFDRVPGFYEMIFDAVAGAGLWVVASMGPGTDPGRFRRLPANIRLEPFMPQAVEAQVLSRAAAVLCHGGYGSILAAMRHGLPVVSIPAGNADDPTRLPGLAGMGAGIIVDERQRDAATVRGALGTVLGDPRYRQAARQAAASMAALPPFSRAAGLVEQLAARRQPVLRQPAFPQPAPRQPVQRQPVPRHRVPGQPAPGQPGQ
jgi:UDP:flavonoid glycosyltransferase YjiC (YdhE family)